MGSCTLSKLKITIKDVNTKNLNGFHGILTETNGDIIKEYFHVSRKEIIRYLGDTAKEINQERSEEAESA